jgi:hypothetical protein
MKPERRAISDDGFTPEPSPHTGPAETGRFAVAWRRARARLASKRVGPWAAALALLLTLRALWGGLHFDDHFHRVVLLELTGDPIVGANMFGFIPGDPESTRISMDRGMLPWWSLETLRWSFWRPLSAATHALDYALWPESPRAMHVHSLLWLALLVLCVSGFYRRFLGATWIAGVATLLYALDDARGIPAAWVANRNSLIAGLFCVLSIWAHDRWRRDGWRPGALLSPLSLGLSLLAAEMGLATLAYLGSYALFLERGAWPRRASSLLGHLAVAATWLYLYQSGGHGVAGSGVYTSALAEPAAFLAELRLRFPMLLLDQLGPPVAPLYALLSPEMQARFAWTGIAACAFAGLALWPLLLRDPLARFWALGCVLSLVPVASALPTSRLSMLSGLGAMGLIAQFLAFTSTSLARSLPRWHRSAIHACAALFVFFHAVVGPIYLPLVVWANTLEAEATNALLLSAPLGAAIEQKTVTLINPPVIPQALMLPLVRLSSGLSAPRHFRVLAPGLNDVRVARPDARTLVVTPSGGFLSGRLGTLFRAPEYPMQEGQTVELTGMRATVIALGEDGTPATVRFQYDRPLEDADHVWLACVDRRYVPFRLPEIGAEIVLPGALSPAAAASSKSS